MTYNTYSLQSKIIRKRHSTKSCWRFEAFHRPCLQETPHRRLHLQQRCIRQASKHNYPSILDCRTSDHWKWRGSIHCILAYRSKNDSPTLGGWQHPKTLLWCIECVVGSWNRSQRWQVHQIHRWRISKNRHEWTQGILLPLSWCIGPHCNLKGRNRQEARKHQTTHSQRMSFLPWLFLDHRLGSSHCL